MRLDTKHEHTLGWPRTLARIDVRSRYKLCSLVAGEDFSRATRGDSAVECSYRRVGECWFSDLRLGEMDLFGDCSCWFVLAARASRDFRGESSWDGVGRACQSYCSSDVAAGNRRLGGSVCSTRKEHELVRPMSTRL